MHGVKDPDLEGSMPTFVDFNTFAALPEEQISEKISRRILAGDQGMLIWWSIGAGVHVEPHSHANEQIAWMLKGQRRRSAKALGKPATWTDVMFSSNIAGRTAKAIGYRNWRPIW